MSISSSLYRLQQIDTQIDQSRARLGQVETLINDRSAQLEAETALKTASDSYNQARRELTQIENQTKDLRIKIQLNEANLYGGKVRNPKELQDLQNEIASLKKYLGVLEDRQIDAMIAAEEAEGAYKHADQGRLQAEARSVEQNAVLSGERSALNQTLERLQVERGAAESAITPQDLEVYQQLRKSRSGVAVTRIVEKTCSACGFGLPPALAQAASSPTQIVRCTSCSRILYNG